MKTKKGSITVEATIIMPVYILLLAFLISFLNIFYLQLIVQSGLNNAANTMAQYCYAIDLKLGMENLTLSDSTSAKVGELKKGVDSFSSSTRNMAASFQEAFTGPFSIDELTALVSAGERFVESGKSLGSSLKSIDGNTIKDYLLTSASEIGGGMIVRAMVENYLDEMKVNRDWIDGDIQYGMYVAKGSYDLILTACYQFRNREFSLFMKKPFVMKQQAVVHPWIGGSSEGLRKSQEK